MTKEEAEIENELILKLVELKYVRRDDIKDRTTLENNFRKKFELLNKVKLTDAEFTRLLNEIITPDVFVAAQRLREYNTFHRDDGTPLQYMLVNTKDWCKNEYEAVNQLRIDTDESYQRHDVSLLINGLPLVQIELKTLNITPQKAVEQIVRYKNEPGNGFTNTLLCFMQIFIVSNRSTTWYFANNQDRHFAFNAEERFLPVYQHADRNNRKISSLDEFAESFLQKCSLGEMISRYMVLVASEQELMIMRPYQIYAVRAIVECIQQNRGNGYVWHTTGSGKTLTSFKASTLLKDNPEIAKCVFVVDRKDLDKHTRDEFNKFQEGCVEENTSTRVLVQRLLSEDYANKIIVTTIQKLGLALDENKRPGYQNRLKSMQDKRIVFIFDECHRSQFGENHKTIRKFFPIAQLFGFTGTPIFEENAFSQSIDGTRASHVTTEDIFQKRLHEYTIANAIDDDNVLRFHIDHFAKKAIEKTKTDRKTSFDETKVKENIINRILDTHDSVTDNRRFNAFLATDSIEDAIVYYELFEKIQKKHKTTGGNYVPLNIACIFSPPAEGNKDIKQLQDDLAQEREDNKENPRNKKEALDAIISDYNSRYGTDHKRTEFDRYSKDVQQRIKDQKYSNRELPHEKKIDIVIVVDMLLTGFDSKYLKALYVDKELKQHGMIQAFSRTNRILNATKPFGNILDFRGLESQVDEAISLFSGSCESPPRKIWLVEPAPVVIEKYEEAVDKFKKFMTGQNLTFAPEEISNLKGDEARISFVNYFKEVRRLKKQIDQYTDIDEDQQDYIETIITTDDLDGFHGRYIETYKRLKPKETSSEQVVLLDFELVLFSSTLVDYDYIMKLIARYSEQDPEKQNMTRTQLVNMLKSSASLMDEHDDIEAYIDTLRVGEGLSEQEIREGFAKFKKEKSRDELSTIAKNYGFEDSVLQGFVDDVLDRMIFDGQELTELCAPLNLGWKERVQKEQALMKQLVPFLRKQAGGREISGLEAYE